MKPLFLFFLLLLFFLAACGEDEIPITPTPFDMGQTAVAIIAGRQPTAVSLAELSAGPELFTGQFLQLSGAYQHLPLLVCNGEMKTGPAGWLLVDTIQPVAGEEGEEAEIIEVAAGGFDSQLRSLVPEGTPLTVNGFWRYWEGPVGCGKQAVPRQLWYFLVTEIVEPAQLARRPDIQVTAAISGTADSTNGAWGTPEGGGTAVPGLPITPTLPVSITPTQSLPLTPTLAIPPAPTATPTATTNAPPELPPTATVEETKEGETTPNPTLTLTNTPQPGASLTPTPAMTNTPSPTITPAPTGQPGNYAIIEVEPIEPDEAQYGLETMGAWQKQNWPVSFTSSTAITISVAAEPTMDMVVAVFDEVDNVVWAPQNNAPAGQMEQVVALPVNPANRYVVQVYETNGREGNYFMTIEGNGASVIILSRGILTNDDTQQDFIIPYARHFWYYYGEVGDTVDVLTTADDGQLMLIWLRDQRANLLTDDLGTEEELLEFTLPETGLYLVWLEELSYEEAFYEVTVTNN